MHQKLHKKFFSILLMSLLIVAAIPSIANAEILWDTSIDQPTDKTWTITFNKPVDPTSVDSSSVYVEDKLGNRVETKVLTADDQVIISPPTGGYTHSATYFLYITTDMLNSDGTQLKEGVKKKFSIIEAPPTYDTATLHPDGSTTVSKSFDTYDEALAALTAGQVILYDNDIIKMDSGIVVTKPTKESSLTVIYSDPSFSLRHQETYVSHDTELEYVESTDAYVKIKVAGKPGYITHAHSNLLPWSAVKDRSYYSTRDEILTHYVYSNRTDTFSSYQAGKAPSFMKDDVRYYSWDGIDFTDHNGAHVGTGYQYFQFLPARSKTQYTAEEIDAYILKMLKSLETDYPNNSTYKNASEKSKLIGLGTFLKQIEEEKKINALHILALAQNESKYGLSPIAQQSNNLFGLNVQDDNPVSAYFETVEDNILELVKNYLNKNYIPATGGYANGAIFGNKAVGFTVRYAADPYWGAKNAGHMYRIDKMMGGRDLENPYTIGLSTSSRLNVRPGPGIIHDWIFFYNKMGMPLIIVEPVEPSPWLKIVSDAIEHDELFVSGDHVEVIPTVQ